jgi:hypothetical protein
MISAQEIEEYAEQFADPYFNKPSVDKLIGHLDPFEARAVWERTAEIAKARADQAEAEVRLARAAGCPENVPMIPWLIEQGLIIHTDGVVCITQAGMKLLQ